MAQNLAHPNKALRVTVSGDEVMLPSQAATALALATTELIQNALERAFVERSHGTVEVRLCDEGRTLTVTVADDGIGFAADDGAAARPPRGTSLGLDIVQTLVTEDLKGRFTFESSAGGTQAVIQLPRPAF